MRGECSDEVGVAILLGIGRTLGIWKIDGDVEGSSNEVPSLASPGGKCQASQNGH